MPPDHQRDHQDNQRDHQDQDEEVSEVRVGLNVSGSCEWTSVRWSGEAEGGCGAFAVLLQLFLL